MYAMSLLEKSTHFGSVGRVLKIELHPAGHLFIAQLYLPEFRIVLMQGSKYWVAQLPGATKNLVGQVEIVTSLPDGQVVNLAPPKGRK